jgi:serine/threonine protein kinase
MHQIGDIIDQRYLLTRPLGVRQEAEMWEAQHQISGRKVTVKLVGNEDGAAVARARFASEARVASEIGHPGIVDVFDVGMAEGAAYLVMELLRGETLADIIAHQGAMQAEDACHVMLQVLRGLEAAHAAGFTHGDLRAESVVLRRGRDGQLIVKLLDFGASGKFANAGSDAPVSAARAAIGFDAREDIQAAGVILYDMLTGRVGVRQGARAQQGTGSIPAPETAQALVPAIPAGLARIVDQAMATGNGRPVASAREMASLLSPFAVSEQAPSLAPRDTLMPFLSPEARRSRGMARLERAVLGLADPKEKTSVRPNLVLIEGTQDTGVRSADAPARRGSEAPRALPAQDLLAPRIPRPPLTPELGDSHPRVSRGGGRAESGNRSRKRNSIGHRRWRASRHSIGSRVSDLSSLQAAAMNRVMRRIWSAGLLAAAGMGAGLLLGHLLHF